MFIFLSTVVIIKAKEQVIHVNFLINLKAMLFATFQLHDLKHFHWFLYTSVYVTSNMTDKLPL